MRPPAPSPIFRVSEAKGYSSQSRTLAKQGVYMSASQALVSRRGRAVSGRGTAKTILAGHSELSDYFGAEPQPGSLNIILDQPILFRPERAAVRFDNDRRLAWPAMLERQPYLVHRWKNCPLHVVELISPFRFQIQKGEHAFVDFNVADTEPISWGRFIGWGCLWLFRQRHAYSDDKYFHLASELSDQYPVYFGQQSLANTTLT